MQNQNGLLDRPIGANPSSPTTAHKLFVRSHFPKLTGVTRAHTDLEIGAGGGKKKVQEDIKRREEIREERSERAERRRKESIISGKDGRGEGDNT